MTPPPDCLSTVDALIARLQEIRETTGGDCPVLLKSYGRELVFVYCSLGAVGKSNPFQRVSRGGTPCVILSE